MAFSFIKNKKGGRSVLLYTILTFVLIAAMILCLLEYLYTDAEERAFENLHVQTKQIKDDITLQLMSDRENLQTMANFAAKLYLDGDDYHLLFNSFKPIGLIENIGILNPDNSFITKSHIVSLEGKISFDEEVQRGAYFSGRVPDLTNPGFELVRSAVPIVANGETVGILYGVIRLDNIENRYLALANELNAQVFIWDAENGDLILDTVHDTLANISFLKERKYNDGYSYEEFAATDKGFLSFRSAYKNEDVLLHYSTLDELGWQIAMIRYDSQVFAETHSLTKILVIVFVMVLAVMCGLIAVLTVSERTKGGIGDCAANVRKILLETSKSANRISDALREVCLFTESRSAIFFDTNGEHYNYIAPKYIEKRLSDEERAIIMAELIRYVTDYRLQDETAINVISLKANKRLKAKNADFYALLKKHKINEIIISATVNTMNHITVLSVMNAKRSSHAKLLAEKVSACFSIALSNHTILNRTKLAATTDSLTGALNRVAYNNDLHVINDERPLDFACIYVDVNELHFINNKFGHAAGDEMLTYIAYTLKDVFFGHKVYRLGGDEFLVLAQNVDQDDIKKSIEIFLEKLQPRDYHVALGISFRSQNTNTEEMVREAEVRMYESKAKYYQNKEQQKLVDPAENEYLLARTGITEIDTMLSILKENYNGIYRVSLDADKAKRVLMPAYLKYNETEENFSQLFAKYVSESAESDYHRSLLSFRNYDALKQQLAEGRTPRISYKKLNGENVTLSVYKLCDSGDSVSDTLWIFAKK